MHDATAFGYPRQMGDPPVILRSAIQNVVSSLNSDSQASSDYSLEFSLYPDYKDYDVFPTTDLNSIETEANPVRKVISTSTRTATVSPPSAVETTSAGKKSPLKILRNFPASTTEGKLATSTYRAFLQFSHVVMHFL